MTRSSEQFGAWDSLGVKKLNIFFNNNNKKKRFNLYVLDEEIFVERKIIIDND